MKRIYNHIPDTFDPRDYCAHDTLKLDAPMALPAAFDFRASLMPCYDQGQVGSCTGNSTAGACEADMINQGLAVWTPSRLFLYFNGRAAEGTTGQDAGAMIRDVVAGVSKYGFCPETYWPYDEKEVTTVPASFAYGKAYACRIVPTMYARVKQNVQSIKQVCYSKRGVIIGFTVYESFENIGADGLMPMPKVGEQVLGGHAVLIVGWDDSKQAFVVRNSWGTSWGDNGHFYAPYAYFTNPKLASDLWTITSVPKAA